MNRTIGKLLLAGVLCLSCAPLVRAQAISSPYTFGSLGLGESQTFIHQQLMGGLSSVTIDKGDFSMVNPASLHALEQTSLQTGSAVSFVEQTTGDSVNNDFNGDFGYFSMGIPLSLKRKIGFGFQIGRVTHVNYVIPQRVNENGEEVVNIFAGQGGINQFKTSLGIQVIEGLSLGVGTSFMFGNIQEQLDKQFTDNRDIFSLRNTKTTYYSGAKFDFGVQYSGQISEKTRFTIGGQVSPGMALNTSADEFLRTYNYNGNYFIDTITSREEATGEQALPLDYGAALSVGRKDRWMVGAEYNVSQWSKLEQPRNANPFFDQQSFTIGGYIQLKERMSSQRTSRTQRINDYLKTIRFYYGFRMQSHYTGVVNEQIDETAISLGFGLPFTRVYSIEGVKYRMVSRINVGAEYLIRGKADNGLIQENILGIKVGLTFNDKWFNKRKYQ